jgi:uncharacterized tellurite resistance protein B-like protein
MPLLKLLGIGSSADRGPGRTGLAADVRRQLESLSADRAEFVAAFAGLLVRVAHADVEICADEQEAMRQLIAEHAELPDTEAAIVAELVTARVTGMEGIEYAELTRSFNDIASVHQKEQLIDSLFAIAAAGTHVSVAEDEEIRAVARALLLTHDQFAAIRSRYKEQREVIQGLRPKS